MSIENGSRVRLSKLNAKKFNGELATVVEYQSESGRYQVKLDSNDTLVTVKPENLHALVTADATEKKNTLVKKLAHNDKIVRDKSIRLLKKWLVKRKEIGEMDMLKIWKGIFYCFWMSDKPAVQHDLADRLSEIVQSLEVERGMLFMKAFYSTVTREWIGIDRLRLDKFMTLVRKFTCQLLIYCQIREWDDDVCQKAVTVLAEWPLNTDRIDNRGMLLHITDIFITELSRIHAMTQGKAPVITTSALHIFLAPFYRIISTNKDKALIKRVVRSVFEPMLVLCNDIKSEDEEDEEEPEALTEAIIPAMTSLSKQLFKLASSKDTSEHLRSDLYKLRSQFQETVVELGLEELEKELEQDEGDVEEEVEEVEEVEKVIEPPKKKEKRKKEQKKPKATEKRQKTSPKQSPKQSPEQNPKSAGKVSAKKNKKKQQKDEFVLDDLTSEEKDIIQSRKKIKFEKIFPTEEKQDTSGLETPTKKSSNKKKKNKSQTNGQSPELSPAMVTPTQKSKKKSKTVKSAIKYPSTPVDQISKKGSETERKSVCFAYPISMTKEIPKIGRLKASDFF